MYMNVWLTAWITKSDSCSFIDTYHRQRDALHTYVLFWPRHGNPVPQPDFRWRALFEAIMRETFWYHMICRYGVHTYDIYISPSFSSWANIYMWYIHKNNSIPPSRCHDDYMPLLSLIHNRGLRFLASSSSSSSSSFSFFIFIIHHALPQPSPSFSPCRNLRRKSSFVWLQHFWLWWIPRPFSGSNIIRGLKSRARLLPKRRRTRRRRGRRGNPRFHRTPTADPTATDRLLLLAATRVRRVQDRRGSRPCCGGTWLCIVHKSLLWGALWRNPHF